MDNYDENKPATKAFITSLLTNLKNDFEKSVEKKVKNIILPLENEIKELKEQRTKLESRMERLEKKERMKNIILHGFPDGTEKSWVLRDKVIDELTKIPNFAEAGIDLTREITYARRLGREVGKRPILIEFVNICVKREIFEWKSELKEMGYTIASDFTKEERMKYADFKDIKKAFMKNGEAAKLINGKIEVNNRGLLSFEEAARIANGLNKYDEQKSSPEINNLGKRLPNRKERREEQKRKQWKAGQAKISQDEEMEQ